MELRVPGMQQKFQINMLDGDGCVLWSTICRTWTTKRLETENSLFDVNISLSDCRKGLPCKTLQQAVAYWMVLKGTAVLCRRIWWTVMSAWWWKWIWDGGREVDWNPGILMEWGVEHCCWWQLFNWQKIKPDQYWTSENRIATENVNRGRWGEDMDVCKEIFFKSADKWNVAQKMKNLSWWNAVVRQKITRLRFGLNLQKLKKNLIFLNILQFYKSLHKNVT